VPTFLQPVELPEKCFLQEVLYWVAFQRLPIADRDSDGNELRETADIVEEYDIKMPDRFLQDDECARANIPSDPRLAALISYRPMINVETFDRLMLSGSEYDYETRKRIESQRQEVIQFQTEYEEFKLKYEAAIEYPASQILIALKKGELKAKGRNYADLNFNEEFGVPAFYSAPILDIPPSFWSLKGIDFDASAARNDHDHYYHIFCRTEDVLAQFPGDKRESVYGVERIGTSFFIKDEPNKPLSDLAARRGRPPLPWEPFHHEVTALLVQGALPTKKEAAIKFFQDWFLKEFRVEPSRSKVGEKLKPYYDRFVKVSDRKS
jgi:hypothetical protein